MWKWALLAATAASGAAIAQHQHHDAGQEASPLNRPALYRSAPVPPTAEAQIAAVRAAIARYQDFEVAKREGWKKFGGDAPLMGEHWFLPKERGGVDYVHGDRLDWSRPSNLMYTEIGGRRVLTGVSFNVRLGPGEPVPEGFAGRADEWHVHDFEQAIAAGLQDRPVLRWLVNGWIEENMTKRGDDRARLAMVHVWVTLPNPDGPFAHHNRVVPYLKLGLPAAWANGASLEAAKGLNLATPNGCAEAIDGGLWIANAPGRTKRALHASCKSAVAHVREGLASGDPRRVNVMAEHGWAMFDRDWQRLLSPEQKARIAAITEHGPAAEGHAHH
jgi:hypothetical protein